MVMFYITMFCSILAIALALSARQVMHALLYLILGLAALSINIANSGSPLGGVLLMIIYTGAIMVLFVFVVMLLNRAPTTTSITVASFVKQFIGPLTFSAALFSFLIFAQIAGIQTPTEEKSAFTVNQISEVLFLDGWFFVEMISLLLTAAVIGAFHIGKRHEP